MYSSSHKLKTQTVKCPTRVAPLAVLALALAAEKRC